MSSLFVGEEKSRYWIVCGLLAILVFVAFGAAVAFDFVNYDDGQYVYANEYIAGGFTVEGVRWILTNSHNGHWHPLTGLSHMMDCQLFGLNPFGHHLTNILLHAVTAVLLFAALQRMTGSFWRSALVAAVFAVHPLRAESVVWISERKDVLSGLFFMLALWVYAGYCRRPFSLSRYFVLVSVFILGLLAKPILVTFPFVLLLLDFWPMKRRDICRLLVEKIPLLILSAVFCAIAVWAQAKVIVPTDTSPFSWRFGNAALSYFIYIKQLVLPSGLAVLYSAHTGILPVAKVAGSFLFLLSITLLVVAQVKKRPYLPVGWFFYLGTLVPVIGILQLGSQSHADRYTYLSHVGLLVMIVWFGAELIRTGRQRIAASVLSAVILTGLIAAARTQTGYWKDSVTLWKHTLQSTEGNYIAHGNLGAALLMEGESGKAVGHLEKAVALEWREPEIHNNLAVAYAETGRFEEAEGAMRMAVLLAKESMPPETVAAMLLRLKEYQAEAAGAPE